MLKLPTTLLLLATAASSLAAQRPAGVEVSGIPALNFDADEGFGYGAILALYKYEPGSTTYRWTVQPTLFMTTRGRRDYTLFLDSPSTDTRPWRVTAYAGREQQLAAPYYGIGNETAYDAALETGATRYYYRYGLDRLRASADVQHTLGRPSLRYLIGAGASSEKVNLTPFDSGSTLIEADMNGRRPAAMRTNYVRAGLTWDTRDREIGTTSGTWADVLVQRVDSKLGASWNYTRWTAAARHYEPLGGRVTLANRVVLQNTIGDAPFYSLAELPTTQTSQDGLGGTSSIRGIPKDRYVGKGTLVSNNELRWRADDFGLIGRPSSLVLSGFVDAGRVWSDGVDLSSALRELHSGYGGGVRLAFGPSFVISTDVGHSSQSAAAIYIGLGYLF
ncbi:MAG TPA: BamA/TamA family outer membrane protein [Gemmatimonadaceae bacterium]